MRITKKLLSLVLVLAMVASFAAMSGFEASAASATGRTQNDFGFFFNNNKFSILQVSDIQVDADGGDLDGDTRLAAIRLAVQRYQPDLVLLTGDQTQGSGSESKWKASIDRVLGRLNDCGIPNNKIVAIMGNHDGQCSISTSNQQAYYVSKGCVDFDNNYSTIDLAGGSTGCIPIKASSSDASVAFNVALFDSQDSDGNGYERIGPGETDYNNIVSWYTTMNNTIAESSFKKAHNLASGTNSQGYKNYLVPTLCAQHIILQEVFTTGGLEACASGTPNSVGAQSNYNPNGASAYKLSSTRLTGGKLAETPCCTSIAWSTAAQYHAVTDPGNCVGFCFGHDHDNSFDFVDDNGLHFYQTSGIAQDNYLTDGNPGVRYFDLELDPATGDVSVSSANKKYTDLTAGESVAVNSGRIEALDDNGVQEVNTISCPQIIYVGANGNDLTTQEFGTAIQNQLINYDTKTLYDQDLDVTVVVPTGATGLNFTAICNGGTISSYNSEWGSNANGAYYTYHLNAGATATPNQPVQYELTYTVDGAEKKIYGASWCENIKMPSGYATWQRCYAGDNKNKEVGWIELNYVALLSGTNVYSVCRWNGNGSGYNSSGYFNYSAVGELDAGFKAKGDDRYSLWWWSPARSRDSALVGLSTKFIGTGTAPKSTIYVNKDQCPVVASNDQRYLLGPKLSIWNAHDSDNGWDCYLAGLGFFAGDTGCNPEDYRAAMVAEINTQPNVNSETTGSFCYEASGGYAVNQGLSGVSTTHVNGNTTAANKVGNAYGNRLIVPLTSQTAGEFPADGTNLTMMTGMRVKGNSNGYGIMVYSVEPYYLEFKVYDKGLLRLLITQELEAAREKPDFPHATDAEWNTYTAKLKAALVLYARIDTVQDRESSIAYDQGIDQAYNELNAALIVLVNSNTVKDETVVNNMGAAKSSAINVPHVLYVNGTTIQTAAPFTARNISFTVPSGSSSVTCYPITGAAGANNLTDVQNTAVTVSGSLSGTTWSGSVTGGTATAGGAVYYRMSWVKNNVTYVQYAASYVRTIPMKTTRWYFFVNDTHGLSSDSRIKHEDILDVTNNYSFEGASAIASIYPSQGTSFDSRVINGNGEGWEDDGAGYSINGTGTASGYSSAGTATIFNDRDGANKEDWIGTLGGTTNTNDKVTQYVVANYYYDKSTVTTSAQLTATITFRALSSDRNINGSAYTMLDDTDYTTYSWGREPTKSSANNAMSPRFEVVGTNTLNNNMGTSNTNITNIRVKSGSLPMTTTSTVLCFRKYTSEKSGCWSYLAFAFAFNPVDRINAHSAVNMAITNNFAPQYMTTEWWNTYRTRVLKCYTSIGNLWDTNLHATSVCGYDELKSSIDFPKYIPANYQNLFNAVNACTDAGLSPTKHCITDGDFTNLTYKVPAGDDARYVGKFFGPTMFENDATSFITVLRNRSTVYSAGASETQNNFAANLLDFRYQQSINDYAATITAAAATIRLKPADYTNIDRYTNYYNATNHTIFFDTSNNAGYNNAAADRAFTNGESGTTWSEYVFTNSTATALSTACTGIDRTLKKPSESAAIAQANNASLTMPRLYPASYTYKYGVASPDTTACTYNALRDAYEGLVFRRAAEYYSPNGYAAMDGATYYANYNKTVQGGGTYVYTPVFSIADGTATINKGGYAVVKSNSANAYNADPVTGAGVNTSYNVLNGNGSVASTVTRYTDGTWGEGNLYGFVDVYDEVYTAAGNHYNTTNTAATNTLAIYVKQDIMPALAKVDLYRDRLVENDAVKSGLSAQLGLTATYENNSGLADYAGKIFETGDTAYTAPLDVAGRAWYTATTWSAYAGAKTSATTVNNNTALKAAQQAQVNAQTTNLYQKRNALVARKLSDFNSTYSEPGGNKTYTAINSFWSGVNDDVNAQFNLYTLGANTLNDSGKIYKYNDTIRATWAPLYTAFTTTQAANSDLGAQINNYTSAYCALYTPNGQLDSNYRLADYSALVTLVNGTTVGSTNWHAPYDIGGASYTTGMRDVAGFGETSVTKNGVVYNTTGATWYDSTWNTYVTARNAASAITSQGGNYNYNTNYSAATANVHSVQNDINAKVLALFNARAALALKKLNAYSNSTHKFNGNSTFSTINSNAATWDTNINATTPRFTLGASLVETGTINNYVDATRNAWNNPYDTSSPNLSNLKTNGATYTLAEYYDDYISVVDSLNTAFNNKVETTADYSALLTLVNGATVSNVNWHAPYDINGAAWRSAMANVTGFGETGTPTGYTTTGKTWYVGGAATTSGTWDFYAAKRNAAIAYTSQGGTAYNYATTYAAGTGKAAATQANINAAVKALYDARGALVPKKLDTYSNSAHTFNGKTTFSTINSDAATRNTDINATTARYTLSDSALIKTGTITKYMPGTISAWNLWYSNSGAVANQLYLTSFTDYGATYNLGDYFDKYISVVDNLNTTYTNKAEQTADYTALLKLVNGTDGWRAAYDIGGSNYANLALQAATGFESAVVIGSTTYNTTGKTWYTTTTWNDYAAKRNTASALTSQAGNYAYATNYTAGTGKAAATQASINTAVENLFNARNALALKKLNEYSNTNAWLGGKTTFADINTLAATYDSEINGTSVLYTLGSSLVTNGTIYNYQSATRTAWNNPYDTNAQNLANLKTNGANYNLVDYYDDYQSVIGSLKAAYNAKADQPADYSALAALVNGSTVGTTNWKPGYDIGGANYTDDMRTAAGFDTAVTFGSVTYNTTGAAWYTPTTWSAFVAKRNAGINTLLGTTGNAYAYGTTYTGSAAGSVTAKQAAINTAAQELYAARAALAAKKLSDYSVSAGSAWYTKTTYADINSQAATYNTEIANQTGAVTTVTASPTMTPPYSPNTVNIGSTTRQYYSTAFINNMSSAYASLTTFTTNNADADLATSFKGYRTSLAGIKTLYEAKETASNINAADYTYLSLLLNRTWIPKYDTYGSYNYNGTGYVIGGQFSGSDWYTASTWNAYSTARNAASNASGVATNYNVGTGYANNYGAGSLKMNNQATVNTLVTNLGKAYYNLQYKTVNEFTGTWNGATGYTNICAQVTAMTNGLDATTVIWSNFAGSGDNITYTSTNVSLYDSNAVATIMAKQAALLGTLTATTAGVNASTNINATDVLAEKYNAYLAQLAAFKTAVDDCTKNSANYTELVKQINAWAAYDGYWVTGTTVAGGSNYTYALSRESGLAGTSNGSTWYTAATWTPYNTARNAATNLTAQATNFNYGSTYTSGSAKLDSQTAINTAAKNLYAARQALALRPLSEYNVSWTATQNSTAYADYAAMKNFVNTAANFSWVSGTVSVIESFTGTTPNTTTKNSYTQAAVNAVNAAKAAAAVYCDDAHKLVDCLSFKAALNGINTAYTTHYGVDSSRNAVYQTGWNWIFNQLTTRSGVGTVSEGSLQTYLNNMCNVDLTTAKAQGGVSIETTLANKSTFIGNGAAPKATTANQNTMNTYITNLYNELIATTATSKQVVTATAAARAKAAATVNAYDPMQLNSRTKVTSLSKYTSASVTALNSVINSVGTYTLWNATTTAMGYNASGNIIDGTEATKIWKAAGLTSAAGTVYAENTSSNASYVLALTGLFTGALNDAITYAKTALYVNPTASTLVQKTTTATSPTGATHTYNTFTTASANELIAALGAVNTSGKTINDQATIDQWVCDIIDQADINNTVYIKNGDNGLYGTLSLAGGDNGLKYNAAYYNYLSTEIGTAKAGSVSTLIWDANNNNALIMDGAVPKGAYYYTAATWNTYINARTAAAGDSGKMANNQAAVDTLARTLYNARNALAYKTLDQSQYYAQAQALVARAEAIYGTTLKVVNYVYPDYDTVLEPQRTETDTFAYPNTATAQLQADMATFNASYMAAATRGDITVEAAMLADINSYNAAMNTLEANSKLVNDDSEFFVGTESLLNNFVAGTYTRNGASSSFTSEQLSDAQCNVIKGKLNAIYTILEAGKTATFIYNNGDTTIKCLNDLTDDLYAYCTTARATNAQFAVSMRNDLYDFLDLTVPVNIGDLDGDGVGDLYSAEVPLFKASRVSTVKTAVNNYFATESNWPFVYQLGGNENDGTAFSIDDYSFAGGSYTGTVSSVSGLLTQVGGRSTNYRDSVDTGINNYMTDAISWFYDNAIYTNGSIDYVLAAPSAEKLEELDASFAYNAGGEIGWYTPGYGQETDDGSVYYVLSGGASHIGSSTGSWFTTATEQAVRDAQDGMSYALTEYIGITIDSISPIPFGMGNYSLEYFDEITGNGWSAEAGAAYYETICAEQVELDSAVSAYYSEICNLSILPATEAYRQVESLIFAANGKTIDYRSNLSAINPTGATGVVVATDARGGQIFNLSLRSILGNGNYSYDSATGNYYSTLLPEGYSGGEQSVNSVQTYFLSQITQRLTVDMEQEIIGSASTSLKSRIVYRLSGLSIGYADFSAITSLTAAFLINNWDNEEGLYGLGSYDITDSDVGTAFFESHPKLAEQGTKAYAYRNDEFLGQDYPSGFFDQSYYTATSLQNVVHYLTTNNIVLMSDSDITTSNYTINFTDALHGSIYTTYYKTSQDQVDRVYNGLVALINNLELQPADVEELTASIAEADQVLEDENYYETGEDSPEWVEFQEALAEARTYSDATILEQDLVAEVYQRLADAIAALVPYVDEIAPIVTVYNTAADIRSFCAAHTELGISAADAVTGTYIQPNAGGYTMYVYTNQLNPKFVITLQDRDSIINGGDIQNVKVSKPEKMSVTGKVSGGATANVITPVLDDATGRIVSSATTKVNGAGAAAAQAQTGKNASGTYDSDSLAYMVLSPQFVDNSSRQAAVYTINAADSAKNKQDLETDYTNAADSLQFTTALTETVDNEVATEENKAITVFVYYMNSMPATGLDGTAETRDEGGFNTTTNTLVGPSVLDHREQNQYDSNQWLTSDKLYREFSSYVRNWEFVSPVAGNQENTPEYNDPNFGTSDLGSFVYALEKNTASTSLDYAVAREFYLHGSTAAKAKMIQLLNQSAYMNYFKNNAMKTDNFIHYGSGTNWMLPVMQFEEGTILFVHVVDRWGNVCNRIIEINHTDAVSPVMEQAPDGMVYVNEIGGSGITRMDIFSYIGTQGSSLYTEYNLSSNGAILTAMTEKDAVTGELKPSGGGDSSNPQWLYSGSNYTIENLIPGRTYTLACTDGAGSASSLNVTADANGRITVSATQESASEVLSNSKYGVGDDIVITPMNDDEDLGLISFMLNGTQEIILNGANLCSIEEAGPAGNVFANKSVPISIITKDKATSVKVVNKATGEEEIWTAENATVVTNEDGTKTWTVKKTFVPGDYDYTAYAMADSKWEIYGKDFSFTATTRAVTIKIQVSGIGKSVLTYNGGNRATVSTMSVKTVPYGSAVEIVSTPSVDGSEFLFMHNSQTKRIITSSNTMSFVAVADMELMSQFTSNDCYTYNKKLVVYVNQAMNVIDNFELAEGQTYKVPEGPSLPDHVFTGWSMTQEEIIASTEKTIVVEPVYTMVTNNTVTLTAGDYTVTGDGTYASVDNERALATISASATNGSGAAFLYWLDADTNQIASYNRTYSFFVLKDTELTPVYGDASAVQPVPVARISTVKYNDEAGKVNFYAERSVPDSFSIYQTGVIVTKNAVVGASEDAFVIGTTGVGKGTSTSSANNGFYNAAVAADSGVTVYGRAYIIYENANGDIVTVYSPISSYTVE